MIAVSEAARVRSEDGGGGSVADRALVGAVWLGGVSFLGKAAGILAQVVAAALVAPEEYGAWAMALAASAVPAVLQGGGLGQVLLHRPAEFERRANAAFWLGLVFSGGAAGLVAGTIPLVAASIGRGMAGPLLGVVAATVVLGGLGVVPMAALQAQMRFREIARNAMAATVVSAGATMALAMLGCGAFSLALPPLFAAAWQTLWAFSRVPFRPRRDWETGKWRALLRDSGPMLGAQALWAFGGGLDRLLIGGFAGPAAVGTYFFAFQYCMQSSQLVARRVEQVLTPAFASLCDETTRCQAAYSRAAGVLAWVSAPLLALQAAAAEPLLRLIYGVKWAGAVPLVALLSAGMLPWVATSSAISLLVAMGRFGTMLRLAASGVLFLAVAVPLGGWLAGVAGVTGAVAAYFFVFSLAGFVLALGWSRRSWKAVGWMLAAPLASAAAAALLAGWAARAAGAVLPPIGQLALALGVFGVVQAVAAGWLMPAGVRRDLAQAALRMRARLMRR